MPSWCSASDVEVQLGSLSGQNFGGSEIEVEIVNATTLLKAELGAIISQDLLDSWDSDITAVPPSLRICCAKSAAAQLLQTYALGESKSDRQSKAGGLYSEYRDFLKQVVANKSILTTSDGDNTPVATATTTVTSSNTGKTRKFYEAEETATTAGTFDNF